MARTRTNADRAERAFRALQHDYLREGRENAVRDFLADLRHYCDEEGIDLANEDRIARDHYLTELAEEHEVQP